MPEGSGVGVGGGGGGGFPVMEPVEQSTTGRQRKGGGRSRREDRDVE